MSRNTVQAFAVGAACGAAVVSVLASWSEAERVATIAALRRALGNQLETEDSPRWNPDSLAKLFVNRNMLSAARALLRTGLGPGELSYGSATARTKFFDQALLRGLEQLGPGCQVVLLSAGYDTRGLRFKKELEAAQAVTFEVDQRALLAQKRSRLEAAKVKPSPFIRYVDFDLFTDASLADALAAAGYDKRRKTLFIVDGLTYHLDTCTLDSFITTLKECSAAGSCMAFDYVSLCATDGE